MTPESNFRVVTERQAEVRLANLERAMCLVLGRLSPSYLWDISAEELGFLKEYHFGLGSRYGREDG